MRCIEVETGELKWSKDDWLGDEPQTFASAFMIENGEHYFLFNDIGELAIAKLTPEGYSELDRTKLLDPTSKARGRTVVWSSRNMLFNAVRLASSSDAPSTNSFNTRPAFSMTSSGFVDG